MFGANPSSTELWFNEGQQLCFTVSAEREPFPYFVQSCGAFSFDGSGTLLPWPSTVRPVIDRVNMEPFSSYVVVNSPVATGMLMCVG